MKKTHLLGLIMLVVGTLVFSSCKKEETNDKQELWTNGGLWNIDQLVSSQTSSNPSYNFDETIYNYGTYTFKQDGSGTYTITVSGDFESGAFTYSNTADKLTLIIGNEARVFDILDWTATTMKIKIIENFTVGGDAATYTETLHLKRK